MRIVVLTSETPANVWLVNQLLARHDVAAMVIERRPLASEQAEKQSRRRRMVEKYGYLRTLNKLVYNRFKSRYVADSDGRIVKNAFFGGGTPIAYIRQVPTVVVPNINDAASLQFIRDHQPELLAVCGTSVLKPEVFTSAPRGAINIHTGITPDYRSADPIFWALYSGEPEKVGVTVHFVDKGIDTGAIIRQQPVPVFADDSLASIYVRCIRKGAELYSHALNDIQNGTVRTLDRSSVKGRSFLSVDLGMVQYLVFRWRFRRLARRLPQTETPSLAVTSEVPR